MSTRFLLFCTLLLVVATSANAARYQRTKDGKTLVWNNLRGVAQEATWSGLRDMDGYATGEGTLTWYRLGSEEVNSYTGKMVRGKFEGPVVRQQGQTRLQAAFANGEKVSGWSEPGRTARAATTLNVTAKGESPPESESEPIEPEEPAESASPVATPTASPRSKPRATATPTLTPIPTPRLTPTPLPTLTTRATPGATRTPTDTIVAIPTAPPMRSTFSPPAAVATATPTATATATAKPTLTSTPTATVTATVKPTPTAARPSATAIRSTSPTPLPSFAPLSDQALGLSSRSSSSRDARGGTQLPQAPNAAQSPASALPGGSSARKNPELKKQMIADFKQRTATVLAQMKEATGNFKPIERLEQVQNLPSSVSANVTYLAVYLVQFRAAVGNDTTVYECLDQVETVETLVLAEEATRDLANKDAPAARKALASFANRTSEPPSEDRKALARYLNSIFFTCDKAKAEAEPHLQQAKTLEAAGKKSEALAEYREIDRIYPNRLSTDKIKQLGATP